MLTTSKKSQDKKYWGLAEDFRDKHMEKRIKRSVDVEKILDHYKKGEDITELAIRFGLKKEKICQILIDNKVDVTEETKAILLSSITKSKRQLNIRLNSTDDQLLEEITQKINEKMLATSIGDIEFSLPGGLGLSKDHIARILLKDAIKRLSITLSE